ncbi:hypothetical protein HELRODRAFT_181757 [Helobdella robusta]|uniref:Uncharacterized protein n=1 Tax=Helobdella robusta TaxID=6412 RepID=T1FHA4_HELRO|nr:hypothetical protein HELRODRAFT_181757 [Helobdella robusta]ESN92137.1 hypothetical protein HELRODRAFT_181757 [Helobdella robusta]
MKIRSGILPRLKQSLAWEQYEWQGRAPKPWLPPDRKKSFEVLNLSKRVLGEEVIGLLGRGMKFIFSYTHTTYFDYNNFMKNIINREIKMKHIKPEDASRKYNFGWNGMNEELTERTNDVLGVGLNNIYVEGREREMIIPIPFSNGLNTLKSKLIEFFKTNRKNTNVVGYMRLGNEAGLVIVWGLSNILTVYICCILTEFRYIVDILTFLIPSIFVR